MYNTFPNPTWMEVWPTVYNVHSRPLALDLGVTFKVIPASLLAKRRRKQTTLADVLFDFISPGVWLLRWMSMK